MIKFRRIHVRQAVIATLLIPLAIKVTSPPVVIDIPIYIRA